MKRARWKLSTRLTRTFAAMAGLVALVISSLGAWFLDHSVERELDALIEEEISELAAVLPAVGGERGSLEQAVQNLEDDHPTTPVAWRIWEADGVHPSGEFGATRLLLEGAPAREPLGRTRSIPGGLRWRSQAIADGRVLGVLVDGSARFAQLQKFAGVTLGLSGVAVVLASIAGALFFRRASDLLRRVAAGTRDVQLGTGGVEIDVESAPEEIREVVDALHGMLARIRAESERARLLTAGLAHELGSPLQNLVGETEVALLSPRSPEQYRAVLSSQLEELRQLARTLRNLVTLCSSGERSGAGDLEEFDLGHEAELRLRRERSVAERRGVRLEIGAAGDLGLRGDREGLLLALANLVSNAIDWSPAGGTVAVALDGRGAAIELRVDDSGPGIPEELRERVFEAFYRGPAAEGRRVGYGLGLAIARAAVIRQGGGIAIESSPSGGARFRVTLPRDGRLPGADQAEVARAHALSR